MLSAADAAAIDGALARSVGRGLADPAFVSAAHGDEDVHAFVERELVARVGDAGRRLHTGRSRNEQVAVDLRLYLKRRVPQIQRAIAGSVRALVDLADRAGDALMPSYTHLRRAQPVLVAHFLLSHCAALRRDVDRLTAVLAEADELPLGSGAIAGTGYAIDVKALADALGFARVARNSIDASGDRDFVASFLHAASLGMVHLSRIAEDFILFTSEEFGFFELDDRAATGSSLMPQKKNPDPLELVRGKSGRVIGRLTGWLATMKGLPPATTRICRKTRKRCSTPKIRGSRCLRATASVIDGLTPNAAVTARAASGLLLATDVADYLVAKGLPFRDAHEVVGALVRRLLQETPLVRRPDRSTNGAALAALRRRCAPGHHALASVEKKRTPQSTHPEAVAAALAETREVAGGREGRPEAWKSGTSGSGYGRLGRSSRPADFERPTSRLRNVLELERHADRRAPEVEVAEPEADDVVAACRGSCGSSAKSPRRPTFCEKNPSRRRRRRSRSRSSCSRRTTLPRPARCVRMSPTPPTTYGRTTAVPADRRADDEIARQRRHVAVAGELEAVAVGSVREEVRRVAEVEFDAEDAAAHPGQRHAVVDLVLELVRGRVPSAPLTSAEPPNSSRRTASAVQSADAVRGSATKRPPHDCCGKKPLRTDMISPRKIVRARRVASGDALTRGRCQGRRRPSSAVPRRGARDDSAVCRLPIARRST